MAHCHCSMCRKHTGAALATYGEAKKENFRWNKGTELLESYVASNGTTRKFCRVCGSSMTFKANAGKKTLWCSRLAHSIVILNCDLTLTYMSDQRRTGLS